MLRVRPFHALRPAGSRAATVSCPPPGNGPEGCGCSCGEGRDDSFRSALDAGSASDVACIVQRLVELGALCADPEPLLYVYRIARCGERQVGVVAYAHIGDIDGCADLQPAWREPALVTYDDPDEQVATLAVDDMNERPIFHFNAGDGSTHSAWLAQRPQRYVDAFARMGGPARLLSGGALVGDNEVLALLVANVRCCPTLAAPRCGLFVPKRVLGV